MSSAGKATRPGVRLIVIASAAILVSVVILAFLIRPAPQPPPASGKCTTCGAAVLPIGYGQLTFDAVATRSSAPQSFPHGRAYFRHRDPKGDWLEGGCVVNDDFPGWICEGCGRTWPLPPRRSTPWLVRIADWFWGLFR